ncbi:hypothetical protein WJR50_16845 [Catalinimonas sp. 4WD22]|uniref:hypothetical protein n=1 Tax=Catalinimonas locisalis TaxID=3133978 RepID=UPI003100E24E
MMAVNFRWKLIRTKRLILLLIFSSLHSTIAAQSLAVQDSIAISKPLAVSFDALGHLYIVTTSGELSKYDQHLEVLQTYSSPTLNRVSNLDATQMLKIFAFYESSQEFQFFDRFLTPSQTAQIKVAPFSHFSVAALSNDQMIWLFDENNLQLVKYSPIQEDLILKVDLQYFLSERAEIKTLKEYGNRLFLWQDNEILVFDFLGNLINKFPIEIDHPFQISSNQLYYAIDNKVYFFDLLTSTQEKYIIPGVEDIQFVILIDKNLVVITDQQIKTFLLEL